MEKTHTIQSLKNTPDTSKGQKIVAALYLVTNHLPDTDPIKHAVRTHAIALVEAGRNERTSIVERIALLLGAATLARIVNEGNVAILSREMNFYATLSESHTQSAIGALFEHDPKDMSVIKRTENKHKMSFMGHSVSLSQRNNENTLYTKNTRQDQILSFINERKSAGIKDIATLFMDVSEKTIQRELGVLVASGKITKRGSKRWSMYMAVTSNTTA